MTKILVFALIAVLTACATYEHATAQGKTGDNILVAMHGQEWHFVETDDSGKAVRTLSVVLSDQPADTCIGGDWKAIRVISDPSRYTRQPAYVLTDGRLEILLVNGLCDAYDSYIFDESAETGVGLHRAYGMFGGNSLGRVVAHRMQ
jgi:hypothetical protein